MNLNEDTISDAKLVGYFLLVLMAFFIGMSSGIKKGIRNARVTFEKEAITNGCAIYNPTNGVWQWK